MPSSTVAFSVPHLRACIETNTPEYLRSLCAERLREPLNEAAFALDMAALALDGPDPEAGVLYAFDALRRLAARLMDLERAAAH